MTDAGDGCAGVVSPVPWTVMTQRRHPVSFRTFHDAGPALLALWAALGAACSDDPPSVVFEPADLGFGEHVIGQATYIEMLTLRNDSPGRADILDIRLPQDDAFTLDQTNCPQWLETDEACTISVAFTPVAVGTFESALVVELEGGEARARLTGSGIVRVTVSKVANTYPIVLSQPAGINCGTSCSASFTEPEIILSVPNRGTPVWSDACEVTSTGACRIRPQGEVTVELLDFITAAR